MEYIKELKLELILFYIVTYLNLYMLFALMSLDLNIANWDSYTKSLFTLGIIVLPVSTYFDGRKFMKSLETKVCVRCNTLKTLEEFVKDSRRKDYRKNVCKLCASKEGKLRRMKNPNAEAYANRYSKYE